MSAGSSARSAINELAVKAAMLVVALFVVTLFLAAMPGHRPPVVASSTEQQAPPQSSPAASANEMQSMDHSHMDMDEKASERAAMQDMSNLHGSNPHMTMTTMRPVNSADAQRASKIVTQLRASIEKYKDYHVALNEGFRIFLPNVPQPEYHFTSYKNGFEAAMHFDPSKPTSLLYKKTADGYELVGAMYTMPRSASEEELNARIPLSVAMWHLHTNLCMPPQDQLKTADWTRFGLHGSISTEAACTSAGGHFRPTVFGWMVHLYPYEDSPEKIFAMHHRD